MSKDNTFDGIPLVFIWVKSFIRKEYLKFFWLGQVSIANQSIYESIKFFSVVSATINALTGFGIYKSSFDG